MPNFAENLPVLAPLLALAVGALGVLVLDLVLPARRGYGWWFAVALAGVALAALYTVPLLGASRSAFGGALVADRFGLFFWLVILAAAGASLLLSLSRSEEDASGYLALLLWAAMGMAVLAAAGNLMVVFLGLEILSLALYVLVAFAPGNRIAWEAALKYFLLGAVAAGFLLFGFALIYGAVGGVGFDQIADYARGTAELPRIYKLGVGLSLTGFAFKLALVPFHVWAPDAYEGAPTPVTAFMSVGTKAAAFAAMARFLVAAVPPQAQTAYLLPLGVLAALSMLVGALAAIRQENLKRILAYSGISHAGYLIMALPGLTEEGLGAGLFYLAGYLCMNMALFAGMVYLRQVGEDGESVASYTGLLYRRPALAGALALALFALAGLPPTVGFTGKFLLALAAIRGEAWLLLGALILATGVSAYVYLRVVAAMARQPEKVRRSAAAEVAAAAAPAAGEGAAALGLPDGLIRGAAGAVLVLAVAGMLLLGVLPGRVLAALTGLLG